MLYLVATPIGNLSDITFRAVETLKICDYILCEDTRHSLRLLQHYDIKKPLKSYHKFNESSLAETILQDIRNGKTICLISDAGTPGIADPGAQLVKLCRENDLPVTSLPGPCAALQALTCSGLPTETFQFIGFLPRKVGALKSILLGIQNYPGTTICYESPHRLIDTLKLINELQPVMQFITARELTKKFEEVKQGTASDHLDRWNEGHPKGEFVLLFPPNANPSIDWSQMSPEDHVLWAQENYSITKKEALKLVAELRG
ncbi:MAG: 16S rRNA (cytidine(1402)-2'-O)-methyltransferase, partial [Parachlamydia sp.]|nr:16S rRNA (cytidine(1402)-2'-O)-methyltransferase [Parachlamydia sp.]